MSLMERARYFAAGLSVLGILGGLGLRLYRNQLAVMRLIRVAKVAEPNPGYVKRAVRYRIGKFVRPRLVARMALSEFATNRLGAMSATVTVPAILPREISIDRLFVPLSAEAGSGEVHPAHQLSSAPQSRILLIGEAGSGKSTIAKKIYRDICQQARKSPEDGCLPVLLRLRELNVASASGWIFDVVRSDVAEVRTYDTAELFDSMAAAGRLVVLLDGLDEVRTSDLEDLCSELLRFASQLDRLHPDNRLIITTRSQLYSHLDSEFQASFSHYWLRGLASADIYDFLQMWPFESNPSGEAARIFGNLAEQPNIREMCSSPLILAMYVATDQLAHGMDMPKTRPDFYSLVVDELLVRRRSRQRSYIAGSTKLLRDRQRQLGRIAFRHLTDMSQNPNVISWEMAVEIIVDDEKTDREAAEQHLFELSRDTGLFSVERRSESLVFVHLTFCEYLAARSTVNGPASQWSNLQSVYHTSLEGSPAGESRFDEVFVFAIGLEQREEIRNRRLEWMLRECDTMVVLRAVWEAQLYDELLIEDWLEVLMREISSTPLDSRHSEWLRLFYQLSILLRDRDAVLEQQGAGRPRSMSLLSKLLQQSVGTSEAALRQLFIPYTRADPAGALRLASAMGFDLIGALSSQILAVLDEPAVLAHAIARVMSSTDAEEHISWCRLLAARSVSDEIVRRRLLDSAGPTASSVFIKPGARSVWRRGANGSTLLSYVMDVGCEYPANSKVLQILGPVRPRRGLRRLTSMPSSNLVAPSVILGVAAYKVAFDGATSRASMLLQWITFPFLLLCALALVSELAISLERSKGFTLDSVFFEQMMFEDQYDLGSRIRSRRSDKAVRGGFAFLGFVGAAFVLDMRIKGLEAWYRVWWKLPARDRVGREFLAALPLSGEDFRGSDFLRALGIQTGLDDPRIFSLMRKLILVLPVPLYYGRNDDLRVLAARMLPKYEPVDHLSLSLSRLID